MFVLTRVFVDDKKLADVLRALSGKVHSMDPPQPVINATVRGGKLSEATEGSLLSLFLAHIKKEKLKQVTLKDARRFLEGLGKSESSAGYVIKQAVMARALRRSKTVKHAYDVIGE
jgi:hypothetical protein